MTDTYRTEERLRRFVTAADDSDWQDVVRRAADDRSSGFRLGRAIPGRLAKRRHLVGLSAVVVAAACVVVGVLVTAASPSSASAAARRALAATAAAPSGTMTTTVLHAGVSTTIEAVRWNGHDIAYSPGDGPIPQLLLVGGGMYAQTSDGTWLHYANASDAPPKPLGGLAQLAQHDIDATAPQQILALATGVQKTTQPNGSTVYTGTIPASSLDPALITGNDAITNMIIGAQKRTDGMVGVGKATEQTPGAPCCQSDLLLQMSVGSDGLVEQVSVTFQQQNASSAALDGSYTWSITYSQLGSTPPIGAPPNSTDVPPGTLPPGTVPPGPKPAENGGRTSSQTITPADQSDYLDAARCMRSHGVTNFPDPTFANNTVTFKIPPNIDRDSSQAKAAEAICVKLIPPGLPYSNSSPGPPASNSRAPRR
jgi:hypothetical protein